MDIERKNIQDQFLVKQGVTLDWHKGHCNVIYTCIYGKKSKPTF